MRKRPDYGKATPEDLARALFRPTNQQPESASTKTAQRQSREKRTKAPCDTLKTS